MKEAIRLLQRATINRLREAGFTELAAMASGCWPQGKSVPVTLDREGISNRELLADFARANRQARPAED